MKRALLLTGLLAISTVLFAKSYAVVIGSSAKAGSATLSKGNYTLKVEGDKAIFTDEHNKSVSVAVKLDTGKGKKFENTSMEASQKDGTEVIKLIHLGGSTTTLEFGD